MKSLASNALRFFVRVPPSDMPSLSVISPLVKPAFLVYSSCTIDLMASGFVKTDSKSRSYSFFRFFWPYLVGSLCTLYFFGLIFAMTSDNGRANFVSFLFIGVPVFIFILGIVLAGKRKNRENEAISLGNEKIKEQREKLEKETHELKSRLSTSKTDLTAYNRYVPKKLCTTASMAKLKALIQSGKASGLQEAIRMLE